MTLRIVERLNYLRKKRIDGRIVIPDDLFKLNAKAEKVNIGTDSIRFYPKVAPGQEEEEKEESLAG